MNFLKRWFAPKVKVKLQSFTKDWWDRPFLRDYRAVMVVNLTQPLDGRVMWGSIRHMPAAFDHAISLHAKLNEFSGDIKYHVDRENFQFFFMFSTMEEMTMLCLQASEIIAASPLTICKDERPK